MRQLKERQLKKKMTVLEKNSSEIKSLPRTLEILGSIPSTAKEKKEKAMKGLHCKASDNEKQL